MSSAAPGEGDLSLVTIAVSMLELSSAAGSAAGTGGAAVSAAAGAACIMQHRWKPATLPMATNSATSLILLSDVSRDWQHLQRGCSMNDIHMTNARL